MVVEGKVEMKQMMKQTVIAVSSAVISSSNQLLIVR